MARSSLGIQLDGIESVVQSLENMPQAIRRATRAAINDQGRDSKKELAQRIARDGVSRAKAGGQISLRRATNKEPVAVLAPTSRRIPYRFWKTTIRVTDSTGTRASVWIRKGGQLMRVWGFVNPKSKRKIVWTRRRKAGEDIMAPAAGHSVKLHFQAAATPAFVKSVGEGLSGKFIDRYNEQLKK
ncbi:hypothetical protein MIH18_23780 (plasmid) [Marinobacter sp. M3C]|jgi:hypothetical protein|uniref:hypothetical protein n=1 Tax=Marinobacter sp. M3C TaxID=2917715 RepID=UPI00200F7816|nr:hypothetical protein [Marinobacter sp. M3C]MCL1485194.1 hypothetical protein [Marinobacter sp.]UQG62782.1 hypothetical protein MIH18_23780 [Marinobacter sp. M3C]